MHRKASNKPTKKQVARLTEADRAAEKAAIDAALQQPRPDERLPDDEVWTLVAAVVELGLELLRRVPVENAPAAVIAALTAVSQTADSHDFDAVAAAIGRVTWALRCNPPRTEKSHASGAGAPVFDAPGAAAGAPTTPSVVPANATKAPKDLPEGAPACRAPDAALAPHKYGQHKEGQQAADRGQDSAIAATQSAAQRVDKKDLDWRGMPRAVPKKADAYAGATAAASGRAHKPGDSEKAAGPAGASVSDQAGVTVRGKGSTYGNIIRPYAPPRAARKLEPPVVVNASTTATPVADKGPDKSSVPAAPQNATRQAPVGAAGGANAVAVSAEASTPPRAAPPREDVAPVVAAPPAPSGASPTIVLPLPLPIIEAPKEPEYVGALRAGWSLLTGLEAEDALALEESFRMAALFVATSNEEKDAAAFALWMEWLRLFVADPEVPREQRVTATFWRRVRKYAVVAVLPGANERWTMERAQAQRQHIAVLSRAPQKGG